MRRLKTADRGEPRTDLGRFESPTAAARRIIELEEYLITGVFFEMLIETKGGSDEEAFDHLEHTDRNTERCYVIKRHRR